jgi:SulP family sulfate permease
VFYREDMRADVDRTAFYEQQMAASDKDAEVESEGAAVKKIDFPKVKRTPFTLAASYANSPRRAHLAQAGGDTLYHRESTPAPPYRDFPSRNPSAG